MPEFRRFIDVGSLDGTTGFKMAGGTGAVSSAGDVNGDGLGDIIIEGDGANYVVFGKTTGFGPVFDLSALDGSNGFKTIGSETEPRSVSSAGDINGDGFDDIIIGSRGASHVVFGKASGFDATIDLSTPGPGHRTVGYADGYSQQTSGAGDVNGDGFDDIVIGESDYYYGGGRSYLVFGAPDFDTVADPATQGPFDGHGRWGGFGFSLSSAGDVNGDGFDDVVIGAPFEFIAPETYHGSSYLIFGATNPTSVVGSHIEGEANGDALGWSVSGAGDFNGDGLDDIIIGTLDLTPSASAYVVFGAPDFGQHPRLSGLDGSNGFRIVSATGTEVRTVSGAGDVNGDGFDDVIIGTDSGTNYVVFGSGSRFPVTFDLTTVDGDNGFEIRGGGSSVSDAGDINGDGFDDLIVGGSYVFFGHRAFADVTRIGTKIGQTINGGKGDDIVNGLGGDDSLVGWGGGDQISGGAGSDKLDGGKGSDLLNGGSGRDFIVASAGEDTADGAGGSDFLDFSNLTGAIGVTVVLHSGVASLPGALGNIAFSNIECLIGSKGGDTLTGNASANILQGFDGDDVMRGAGGDDKLVGGIGNDRIVGGDGNDSVTGGEGTDRLTGNAGLDVFLYRNASESIPGLARDIITDFHGAAVDRIDLSGMDAIEGEGGSEFTFIGTEAFTDRGQVRFFQENGNTFVEMNVAGDLAADMTIEVSGLVTLDETDFVL